MVDLRQGDCLELMKEIPDESVDMILTDPPYGMSFVSNYRKEKYNALANDDSLNWLDGFVSEIYRILKKNSAVYSFCSWHNVDAFKVSFEKKFKIKNIIVWEKTTHQWAI